MLDMLALVLAAAVLLAVAVFALLFRRNRRTLKASVAVIESEVELLSEQARLPEENPDPVIRIHADGRILYANAAAEGVLPVMRGADPEHISPAWQERLTEVLGSNEGQSEELAMDSRMWQLRMIPVRERHYVNLYAREVTDERKAQEAVAAHLGLLDTLLESIPGPVFHKDSDGVYRHCNRTFAEDILGLPRERVLGARVSDLAHVVPADLVALYEEKDRIALSKVTSLTYDSPVQYGDGTRKTYSVHKASFAGADGKVAGLVGVMLDLTERKRAEEVRIRRERRDALLETVVSVCHNLNTPLTKLTGNLDLLRSIPVEDEEGRQKHLARMESAVAELSEVARQLNATADRSC